MIRSLLLLALIAGCDITETERARVEIYFCPETDCFDLYRSVIGSARTASCAIYEFDADLIDNAMGKVTVVSDSAEAPGVHVATTPGIMHDKFCVVNSSKVITGSFNPKKSQRSAFNNVVFIESREVAEAYQSEFEELVSGDEQYRTGKIRSDIEILFCPEDDCAKRVMEELERSRESIVFATFMFTHPGLGTELILKNYEGVSVHGIVEGRNANHPFSQVKRLQGQGVDVVVESSPALMHHKFFVIDNETVITGSFNPTKSGDERNDENVVIVRDKGIAEMFANQHHRILDIQDNQ